MFGTLWFLFLETQTGYFFLLLVLGYNTTQLLLFCMLQSHFIIFFSFGNTPAKEWIVLECFNDNQNRFFIHSQYFHYLLASVLENPISTACIHRIDKHSCQSEGYFLRKHFSHFVDFKTITEIYMNYFGCISLYHDIERMSITKAN